MKKGFKTPSTTSAVAPSRQHESSPSKGPTIADLNPEEKEKLVKIIKELMDLKSSHAQLLSDVESERAVWSAKEAAWSQHESQLRHELEEANHQVQQLRESEDDLTGKYSMSLGLLKLYQTKLAGMLTEKRISAIKSSEIESKSKRMEQDCLQLEDLIKSQRVTINALENRISSSHSLDTHIHKSSTITEENLRQELSAAKLQVEDLSRQCVSKELLLVQERQRGSDLEAAVARLHKQLADCRIEVQQKDAECTSLHNRLLLSTSEGKGWMPTPNIQSGSITAAVRPSSIATAGTTTSTSTAPIANTTSPSTAAYSITPAATSAPRSTPVSVTKSKSNLARNLSPTKRPSSSATPNSGRTSTPTSASASTSKAGEFIASLLAGNSARDSLMPVLRRGLFSEPTDKSFRFSKDGRRKSASVSFSQTSRDGYGSVGGAKRPILNQTSGSSSVEVPEHTALSVPPPSDHPWDAHSAEHSDLDASDIRDETLGDGDTGNHNRTADDTIEDEDAMGAWSTVRVNDMMTATRERDAEGDETDDQSYNEEPSAIESVDLDSKPSQSTTAPAVASSKVGVSRKKTTKLHKKKTKEAPEGGQTVPDRRRPEVSTSNTLTRMASSTPVRRSSDVSRPEKTLSSVRKSLAGVAISEATPKKKEGRAASKAKGTPTSSSKRTSDTGPVGSRKSPADVKTATSVGPAAAAAAAAASSSPQTSLAVELGEQGRYDAGLFDLLRVMDRREGSSESVDLSSSDAIQEILNDL